MDEVVTEVRVLRSRLASGENGSRRCEVFLDSRRQAMYPRGIVDGSARIVARSAQSAVGHLDGAGIARRVG
jgi:hypothetical protein